MSVQWVATGNGSTHETTIQWSTDGQSWHDASSGGFLGDSYEGFGIAYGNGLWVAAGDAQTPEKSLLWSTDGRIWQDASSGGFTNSGGGGHYGYGIAYGSGKWVAVGRGSTPESSILWSPDGRIWQDASSGGFGGSGFYAKGIAYDGIGTWVAVGFGSSFQNSIQWSTDGHIWQDASSGGFSGIGGFHGVGIAYDGSGTWVAVGEGSSPQSTIQWSTDGRIWQDATSGGFPYSGAYYGCGIAYSSGKWVAVGQGSTPETSIQWSTDGRIWQDAASGGFGGGHCGKGVAYSNGLWVAVGTGSTPESRILFSTDGLTWQDASSGGFIGNGNGVASTRSLPPQPVKWVVATASGLIFSTDGTSWNPCTGSQFGYPTSVAYGGGTWIAMGSAGPSGKTLLWSPDGIHWNDTSGAQVDDIGFLPIDADLITSLNAAAYGADASGIPLWVATGYNSIVCSYDGITWFDGSGAPGISGTGVAYGKDSTGTPLWVVSCGDRIIQRSYTGTTWTTITPTPSLTLYTDVAFGYSPQGNPLWVVVGFDVSHNYCFQHSSNGSTWTTASVTLRDANMYLPTSMITIDNPIYTSVSYSRGIWVAVGTSGTLWSTDGQTWLDTSGTQFSTDGIGTGVAHDSSSNWIAVGYDPSGTNYILYSSQGTTWTSGMIDSYGLGIASNISLLQPPPPPSVPCFVTGTQILTPTGYKPVEELQSGDYVLTAEKRRVPIKLFTFTVDCATEDTAPYRIKAGTFGLKYPKRDLHLSARHAVKDDKGRWQIPKYLSKYYSKVNQYGIGEPVTYYHIECPNFYRDNLVAEGLVVESYKGNQGTKGVVYMWSNSLGGWERLPAGKMTQVPKNPKNSVIISY